MQHVMDEMMERLVAEEVKETCHVVFDAEVQADKHEREEAKRLVQEHMINEQVAHLIQQIN